MNYAAFKELIALEKKPWLVSFAQTLPGKIVVMAAFSLPLSFSILFTWWQSAIFFISLITLFPAYRRFILLIAMGYLVVNNYTFSWSDLNSLFTSAKYFDKHTVNITTSDMLQIKIICFAFILLLSGIFSILTHRYSRSVIFRHSTTNLLLILFAMLGLALYAPLTPMQSFTLWAVIIVYGHYFFFIAYTLQDCKTFKTGDFIYEYGRYYPIWGSTAVPYPKGSSYLRMIASKTSEDLAITQLKGVKLMWWAAFLNLFYMILLPITYDYDLKPLSAALIEYSRGGHYSAGKAWVCLIVNFFQVMLALTITGHTIIAACRMCGYRALRNTYKPLQSYTIAEFWNRYYYYFKEVLVDLFFYRAYFTFFKSYPKFRIFFATLAAATFGNIIFHFMYIIINIKTRGFAEAVFDYHTYMIYTLVLGVAIGISQLRNAGKSPENLTMVGKIKASVFVLGFYMLMSIFNETYQSTSIMINLRFLGSLFNING